MSQFFVFIIANNTIFSKKSSYFLVKSSHHQYSLINYIIMQVQKIIFYKFFIQIQKKLFAFYIPPSSRHLFVSLF